MKRILIIFAFITAAIAADAQRSVDALFNKYAGRDGFVTFTLNGNLIKLSDFLDDDDDNNNSKSGYITEVRILAQNKDNLNAGNFYNLAMKDINLNRYEEFMRVKKSDQDVRILVRTEGNKFKEFLLIAGGEDNILIQVKGDMSYAEARKFSNKAKKEHGMDMVAKH